MKSEYLQTTLAEHQKPQPQDSHPAAAHCRGVVFLVFLEVQRIAEACGLPDVDDVDEKAYLRALTPYLRAVKKAYSEQSPRPLGEELGKIRASVREFGRWRRKPTEKELTEIVCRAMGIESPQAITGADEAARRIVTTPKALPPVPLDAREAPAWLPEFAEAVGGNELAIKPFLLPLLNMSDDAARKAIAAIKRGRDRARMNPERMIEQARHQRRTERTDFVTRCVRDVVRMGREYQAQTEEIIHE